jgi:hypothetical protein
MLSVIPRYGPNWKSKVPKMSPFAWHLKAIYEPRWRSIVVAPWNKRRNPKKVARR